MDLNTYFNKEGSQVSCAKYDATNPPWNQIGDPCTVLKVEFGQNSQSRVMIMVKGSSGKVVSLDSNWLDPLPEEPMGICCDCDEKVPRKQLHHGRCEDCIGVSID
jgi:hypothetical protein